MYSPWLASLSLLFLFCFGLRISCEEAREPDEDELDDEEDEL